MNSVVFALCAGTALLCALLLLQAWRSTRSRLLWWSGLCFSGLFLSNFVLLFDKVVFPEVDLQPWRLGITLVSVSLMLYGLLGTHE
jgi:hypothetical protein